MSIVPPPASTINTLSPCCRRVRQGATTLVVSDLKIFTRVSLGGTEVEACLAFSHEVDSGTPFLGIRDDLRSDGGSSQLVLLRATPPVRMGQHEFDVLRDRVPAMFPDLVGGDEHRLRRFKEIAHEIGK